MRPVELKFENNPACCRKPRDIAGKTALLAGPVERAGRVADKRSLRIRAIGATCFRAEVIEHRVRHAAPVRTEFEHRAAAALIAILRAPSLVRAEHVAVGIYI